MRARNARPGAGYTGRADSRGVAAGHGPKSITEVGLPAHVIACLEREGVHTLQDWKRLGKRRLRIFGVVPTTIDALDLAARDMRE